MGRKFVLGAWALLFTAASVPASVSAFCGFYVAGADTELYNNATMVVMMREGTRTVLSMQNNYQGPPSNFAMIIPVPEVLSEDQVKTLPNEVFDRVDTLAAPRLVEYWEQDPCRIAEEREETEREVPLEMAAASPESSSAGSGGVTIEAQFEVGEYEIVILSARDSMGLDTWLRANEYSIPEGAEPMLRPYVEAGMKFFVAKVDVTKVEFRGGQAMLSPLRFHYDTSEFSLPIRLGLLNSEGTQDLIVHILGEDQRYEVANYPNVTVPTNLDVADNVRERFGEFYAALFDETIASNERAVVTEYAWQASNCDPCPGPVLTEADLMTLGADVLGSGGAGSRTAGPATLTALGTVPGVAPPVLSAAVQTQASAVTACHQAHIASSATDPQLTARINVGPDGLIAGSPAVGPASPAQTELSACVASALRGIRLPPPTSGAASFTVRVGLSSTEANPWQRTQRLQNFVLTRLHARYSKDGISEDLQFRPANSIVGGREFAAPNGMLETGSQSSSVNNFQGRYAIRHLWEGEMACESPVRGVWGGPPSGTAHQAPAAAKDLAFAPRGNITLSEMIRKSIPEIGVTAQSEIPQFRVHGEATTNPGSTSSVIPNIPRQVSSMCDCRTVGASRDDPGVPFLLGSLALFGFVLLRRHRRP